MPMSKEELDAAIARLWSVVPVGYGKDFNDVLKYIDYMRMQLNGDV